MQIVVTNKMATIEVKGVVALIDKEKGTINDNTYNDDDEDEFLYIPSEEIDTIFHNNNIPVFLEHCVAYKVGDTQRFYVKQTLINKVLRDVVMCDFVINNTDFIDVLRESMLCVHDIMNNHDEENKVMSSDNFINSTHVKKYINKDVFTTKKGTNITAKKTLLSTFPALSLGHSVPDKKAIELSLVLAGKRPNTVITSVKYHPPNNTDTTLQEENEIKTQKSDFWKVLGSLLSKKNFNRITKVRQDQNAIELPNEEFSMKDNDDTSIDFVVNPTKISTIRKEIAQHGNTELLKTNITRKTLPVTEENSDTPITTTVDMEVVQVNPMVQGQQKQPPQSAPTPNLSQQQQQYQLPGGITITYSQQQPPQQHQQHPGYVINPYIIPQVQSTSTNNNDRNKIKKYKSRKRKLSYSDEDDYEDDDNDDLNNRVNLSQWKRLNNTLEGLSKLFENNNQHQENSPKVPQTQIPTQQTAPVQQLQLLPSKQQQSAQLPFIVYEGVSYVIPSAHKNLGTAISTQENKAVYETHSQNQPDKLSVPQVIINFGDELKQVLEKENPIVKPHKDDMESENMLDSEVKVPPVKMEPSKEEMNKTEVSKTQTFSLPNNLEEAFAQKVNSDSYCFITNHN